MMSQVHYLGHTVSSKGMQPTQDKVRAIRDAPAPTNIHQLKSFLGLINFYAKFLPNLSTILAPLYVLLQNVTPGPHVGPIATESISARQRPTPLLIVTCALLRTATVIACSRCIALWTWRSTVPYNGRRIREANRLCIEVPDRDRTPLFAAGQGSPCHCFCSDQVSTIFTWSLFHIAL